MLVTVLGIRMSVSMFMSGAVAVTVLVLVEDDLQAMSESVSNPTQRREARHMITPLETGNHRLGHPRAFGELLLRLAGIFAQFE